jgi:hypothetical protein
MGIIIGGEKVGQQLYCPMITTYRDDPSIETKPSHRARRRNTEINMIVLHWTGGEGSAERVIRVLKEKSLSVEFIIDSSGFIFQTCDPLLVGCYHAGRFNRRSIGIEVVNYGFKWPPSKKWNLFKLSKKGKERLVYNTTINGKSVYLADFNLKQSYSILRLLSMLTGKIKSIPVTVPSDLYNAMTSEEADSFRGICGHYHLSKRKLDPGTNIMQTIESVGDNLESWWDDGRIQEW